MTKTYPQYRAATGSDEHFILRNRSTLAAAAVSAAPTPKQKFQPHRDSLHQPGNLPHGRNHRFVDDVGGSLHAVQSAGEEFIGTDNLQAGPIDNVVDGCIHAFDLVSYHGSGVLHLFS